MEIWAGFCERAFGITRNDLERWLPPTETLGSRYVTKWFLVHGLPEEAMAAFHLGRPPSRARARLGAASSNAPTSRRSSPNGARTKGCCGG
jgi:hypothetical protein